MKIFSVSSSFVAFVLIGFCFGCGSENTSTSETTNQAANGSVLIAGDFVVGEVLTASHDLTDGNGLGELSYQWYRNKNGSRVAILNATSLQYLLRMDDAAASVYIMISYVDGDGFSESIISDETPLIVDLSIKSQPNILLIIADDQGLDASSQYSLSSDLPNTPTIDRLAAQGIVFDNVWATPACTTTRGTLITGQHGIVSGIDFVPAQMDSSVDTLQRHIKSLSGNSNYQTAVIGKWHIGGANPSLTHPTDSGVDYYAGTISGTIDDYFNWPLTVNGTTSVSNEYHTTKMTNLAIDWLTTQSQQNNPWFLWLAFVAPHSPFHLPPAELHSRTQLSGLTDDINANPREYYLAAIEAIDSEVGRLLNSLSEQELNNTLIVYIGDNGTPAGVIDASVYQRSHSKGTLYEGGIKIPMVVSGKGVARINQREDALINTSDFFATFIQAVGGNTTTIENSYSFMELLSQAGVGQRVFNYSEFKSAGVTGWTVRNDTHKLIEFENGTRELYELNSDLNESTNLLLSGSFQEIVNPLMSYGRLIRNEQDSQAIDITNIYLENRSANCSDYIESYRSTVTDINRGTIFNGTLLISESDGKCIFQGNNIPNHDFNDSSENFATNVSIQEQTFEIINSPSFAQNVTPLSLVMDNAILLNGVKVDLLAAACFGIGDGRIGCNDINQPWRYDPAFNNNGFRIDSHNAHTQPDGSYHYHGQPNALYSNIDQDTVSPLVGFAADGFPIFGPFFDDNGQVRKALSSYQLITGNRPSGVGEPGGIYDGTYRDDYQFSQGSGDLDECNGMTVDGIYGYYITDSFPYILSCFKGTPDSSFNK